MDGKVIISYIDPIFRFCYRRLSNRYDAEDLAAEILCHVLEGMGKYEIESLDSWVWRIAHNRYARFLDARMKGSRFRRLTWDVIVMETVWDMVIITG